MKPIPNLGLALFAVFAFGAMTAASALAANGEWLVAKVEVKENLPAETGRVTIRSQMDQCHELGNLSQG